MFSPRLEGKFLSDHGGDDLHDHWRSGCEIVAISSTPTVRKPGKLIEFGGERKPKTVVHLDKLAVVNPAINRRWGWKFAFGEFRFGFTAEKDQCQHQEISRQSAADGRQPSFQRF